MRKIKVGIVGCGGIARKSHIPALKAQPDVEITAICDVNENCTEAAAEACGFPETFTDYNEMLEKADIDWVDICTPNFMHKDPAVAALQADKHVMVEKPIARNAVEGQAIVDAAKKSRGKLMVAQCFRFRSDCQALKRFIDAGDIGEMYYARVHALRRRGIPHWGVFTDKELQGGGPLIDIGVHVLDATMWLLGHPKPISATGSTYAKFGNRPDAAGQDRTWDPGKFTVEDFAAALVKFDNGATLTIESSFAANIGKNSMNITILGTEGGFQMDPLQIYKEEHGTLVDITPVNLEEVNYYEAEIRAFLDSIINDTEPPVTGEQALMVTKILDAIYQSAEIGGEVRIE